jgi:archaellum component FlaC
MKDVQSVIIVDSALHCMLNCSVHQIMSRLQNSDEMIGRAWCMLGRFKKKLHDLSEKVNGRENNKLIVFHNSMEEISSDALIQLENIIIVLHKV